MDYHNTVKCKTSLELYLKDSQGTLTPVTSSRVVKAREKLKKLTNVQFGDLSTDVYDEMERRKDHDANPDDPNSAKFLPSDSNYHPKRNQARQKLAALPNSRFKDLVNDVLHEISNRLTVQETAEALQAIAAASPSLAKEPVLNGKSRNPNLTVDVEKSNNYYQAKKLDSKSNSNTPITTQSQIKPTTLVPQKSELTWSSDEENDDDGEKENEADVINRSPSKRYTIATNEVLNEHAPENVKFPVDDEPTKDGINSIASKSRVQEFLNENGQQLEEPGASDLEHENEELKQQMEKLEQSAAAKEEQLQLLSTKYHDYDEINNELVLLRENFLSQSDELNELKQITDMGHAKQLSVEDSREFDTLKSYLDKVLEENEELKIKANQFDDLTLKYQALQNRYQSLQEEQESMQNIAVEHQDLARKYKDLSTEHDSLKSTSDDYNKLQKQYNELTNQFNDLKTSSLTAAPISDSVNGSSVAIGALAGAAAGTLGAATVASIGNISKKKSAESPVTPTDQTKIDYPITAITHTNSDTSRLGEIEAKLGHISALPNLYDNYSLFSSTGLLSIKEISNVYASLEKVLIYLNTSKISSSNEKVYNYDQVDPSVLFDLVARYVSNANALTKEITVNSTDIRVEEKKRILKNSISNALSTTKHFVIYRHILPELVLNAALNDVYFSVCSLVALVKIYTDSKSPEEISKEAREQHDEYLKDNATITKTPLAFRTREMLDKSPNQSFTENNVRPLRITQRLASAASPSLENDELSKPANQQHSRTASPMIKNTSILPMIVASSDELNNIKTSPNLKNRSISGLDINSAANNTVPAFFSNENKKHFSDENTDQSANNSDVSLAVSPEKALNIGSQTVAESPEKALNIGTQNIITSPESALKAGTPNMVASPVRGKNIFNKLKKFDSSIEDLNESLQSNKSTPSKVNVGGEVSKAFDKFGAKRRSDDMAPNKIKEENPFIDSKLNLTTSTYPSNREVTADDLKNKISNGDDKLVAAAGVGVGVVVAAAVAAAVEAKDHMPFSNETKKTDTLNESHFTSSVEGLEKDSVAPINDVLNSTTSTANDIQNNVDGSRKHILHEADGTNEVNDKAEIGNSKISNTSVVDQVIDGDELEADDSFVSLLSGEKDTILESEIKTSVRSASVEGLSANHERPTSTSYVPALSMKNVDVEEDFNNYGDSNHSNDDKKLIEANNYPASTTSNGKSSIVESEYVAVENPVQIERTNTYGEHESTKATPVLSLKNADAVEDFNDYGNSNGSHVNNLKSPIEDSLPSANSALQIDEKMARRVSRRLSRRVSRIPQKDFNESPREEGWEYDAEKYEDEDEEEEDFDVDNFNTLNPDNTLRELLLYLEHQTVEVIKAIQQTLQSIRDPKATKGLLRVGANEINSVVNQMAEGTSTLMNQTRYVESMGHAKYVVGVLEDCVARMEALYGSDTSKDGDYAGKSFKQRSAGIAFDVARSTKELVKTVEEASLRDEIAVLDSRLNR